MSRLGKKEISIPSGVEVKLDGVTLSVKGPKGTLTRVIRDEIQINIDGAIIKLSPRKTDKFSRALWGTYASHLSNMIEGVQKPYEKKLILEGVGFKSDVQGNKLNLALGFSHPVVVEIPEGLTVTAEKNLLTFTGIDKELVGRFTAEVRALKKPEPYKGKGFRYDDEVIRRKQGKKTV